MSRTILNPEYANDLNGLFDGSGTIDTGAIDASNITATTEVTTPQVVFPFGTINGTAGGACNITSDGLALFNASGDVIVLSVPSVNTLTVGDGTTTGIINTSQLILASTSFTGTSGGSLNILPDNGSIALFNSSSNVSLTCVGSDSLTIGTGTTTGIINTSQLALPCGSLSGTAGGSLNVNTAGISLFNGSVSGTLYMNSSGQLTWNGVVIS
jgi:hypothetical protein